MDKQNVDIHDYNRDTGFVISTDEKIEWVKNSNKTNMKDANKNNDCCEIIKVKEKCDMYKKRK